MTNTMKKLSFPVYEFRPIHLDQPLLRYNGGEWIEDDGEYDLAFVTNLRNGAPICYYVSLPYYDGQKWSWVKDGKWGAYVSDHPDGNAWHYVTESGTNLGERWDRDKHPNQVAGDAGMKYLSGKHGCANGSSVEFHIGDPYILKGLLREVDMKEVVKFPETFSCCRCKRNYKMADYDMNIQKAR